MSELKKPERHRGRKEIDGKAWQMRRQVTLFGLALLPLAIVLTVIWFFFR